MWFYLVVGALVTLWFINKIIFGYWDRNDVPSVPGRFIFGSIYEVMAMQQHLGVLVHKWYQKFANVPYFGFYNGRVPVLVIRDLDIVRDVLIKEFNSFSTNEFQVDENVDPIMAINPFMVSGEKWKHHRAIMSPVFSQSRIKNVFPLMKTTCVKLEKYLEENGTKTLQSRELAAKFTTENSVMCGFTFNAESFTNPNAEFRVFGRKLFEQTVKNAIKFMVIQFMPWVSKYFRIPMLQKEIEEFFQKFIKSNIESRKNVPTDDFLQVLLQTADNKHLPFNEVVGHSFSFFVEGFETSSAVISYALFEMSRNPDVQHKLFDEITDVLDEFKGDLSFEAIQKMEYLDAVVHETMRLYPALLTLHKVCTNPYELRPLPGKKIGYTIPKGGVVVIPVQAIHREAEHFPDPDIFNPDRFLPEARKTIPKGAFLSFGEGPRMCVGMRFGQTQAKVALLTIVKSYQIKLSPDTKSFKIDPKFFLNAPENPILLNFEKR